MITSCNRLENYEGNIADRKGLTRSALTISHNRDEGIMSVVRRLSEATNFSPETVKMMGEVFDEVWATVEPTYADHKPGEIKLARATLARRIIWLAERGQNDPAVLKTMVRKTLTVTTREALHGS